jgi:hypothetical protein
VSRPRDPSRAAILRRARREARFEEISENSRIAYTGLVPGGRPKPIRRDKRELMAMIAICAELHRPLPPWVAQAVIDARYRWRTGRLKSLGRRFWKTVPRKDKKRHFHEVARARSMARSASS